MGILIAIEGGDGSGKATQTELLKKRLETEGYAVRAVSFPNYDSPASAPVKMYLNGDFGSAAGDVNAYAASSLYAVDRFASYRSDWETFYRKGGIVLADRYTTSNMVHQAVKMGTEEERMCFLDWLEDYEFEKIGLPRPDAVCLLDVPYEVSRRLMSGRTQKTGGRTGDIHENDGAYSEATRRVYGELTTRYGWHRIACTDGDGCLRAPERVHEDVYRAIADCLPISDRV